MSSSLKQRRAVIRGAFVDKGWAAKAIGTFARDLASPLGVGLAMVGATARRDAPGEVALLPRVGLFNSRIERLIKEGTGHTGAITQITAGTPLESLVPPARANSWNLDIGNDAEVVADLLDAIDSVGLKYMRCLANDPSAFLAACRADPLRGQIVWPTASSVLGSREDGLDALNKIRDELAHRTDRGAAAIRQYLAWLEEQLSAADW